ncbi:MAG: response regulator [Chloroflexi bacterium]|nr:response regulator [Chloroflexota bacterium]MCI0788717.1 response regulator [Chloroflexota bacterium]MCI0801755.1 response regulator [Chloroflexota bacterium]MCI0811162.1 response regulator [Chloroflexota bacterium]MCI0898084.1 response regulator [Chloroflexota bacterium]
MLKALIVEDEEDIKQLLLEVLEDKGYQVLVAGNGEIALQRIGEEMPDLIFADVFMPVMDGLDLISRLKENPDTSGIPVVIVTVMNARDTEKKAKELGVEHYLTKPWESAELDLVLERVNKLNGRGR